MPYATATDAKRQICATCQYWHGRRQVRFNSPQDIRVQYDGGMGECSAWRQPRGAGFCCSRYKRWVELP